MKIYSQKELVKLAAEVFKSDEKCDELLATADGQFFHGDKKNAAQLNARNKGGKTPLKVYEIKRSESLPKGDANQDGKLSAEERIGLINSSDTVEMVNGLLEGEKAKTVLAAGVEKIADLEAVK